MIRSLRKSHQLRGDEGASAVEYGLLVAAIAAVIVVLVFTLGSVIKGAFQTTCDNVNSKGAAVTAATKC
jgi:pilus assembly protein Flp/PilA